MASIFVGISGWNFDGWRETFYPAGLKQKDELAYASRRVHSIEVNGTFYSLFRPSAYQSWYEQSPADFCFSIKAPKYITHERRLDRFETPLANFLASGILALGEKLGPILWQFPPTMKFDAPLFEAFMAALPHDMATAAKIGQGHSDWMAGRTYLEPKGNHRIRHAIEGRHESFKSPEFIALARRYGIAIVIGDTAGRWPYIEDISTDFIYLRLHADETKYPNGYEKASLEHWSKRFQIWSSGSQPDDAVLVVPGSPEKRPRQVFAYFDNDVKETAPLNALSVISHLLQNGAIAERIFADLPQVSAPAAKKAATAKKASTEKSDANAAANIQARAESAMKKSKAKGKTAAKTKKAKAVKEAAPAKTKKAKTMKEAKAVKEAVAKPTKKKTTKRSARSA